MPCALLNRCSWSAPEQIGCVALEQYEDVSAKLILAKSSLIKNNGITYSTCVSRPPRTLPSSSLALAHWSRARSLSDAFDHVILQQVRSFSKRRFSNRRRPRERFLPRSRDCLYRSCFLCASFWVCKIRKNTIFNIYETKSNI